MARLEVLQRERAGYVSRGLTDRVKQVDAQIKLLGQAGAPDVVEVPEALPAAVEHAVPAAPKGRRG